MHRLIIAALTLSLLISAIAWGGGVSNTDTTHAAATPRTIPWDCSDWQAAAAVDDAEDARVSVILESLATNRGKTLYCAVDQSDTFTKAETWQAGKDRNERDDTVYYGENGRFRGFLAAQEGYLTDGESGVTGISRARIFEFPEEPRKRRKKGYRTVTRICGTANDGSEACVNPRDTSVAITAVDTNVAPTYDASGTIGVPQLIQASDPTRSEMTAEPRCRGTGARQVGDIEYYAEPFSSSDAYLYLQVTCRERRR